MKILLVAEYYPPAIMGGGEVNLAQIAAELGKQQEVVVLTSEVKNSLRFENIDKVTIIRSLQTGENPFSLLENLKRDLFFERSVIKEVRKLVQKEKFDAIHLFGNALSASSGLNEIKGVKGKLYATIESYPSLCPKGDRMYYGKKPCEIVCIKKEFVPCIKNSAEIGKIQNKWFLKHNWLFRNLLFRRYRKMQQGLKSCRLIAISNYVQGLLKMHGHSSVVIPNMIDVKPFVDSKEVRENAESSKKDKNNRKKIVYLGSLTKFKGPQILVEALYLLNQQGVECVFYGEGPLKEELEEKIRKKKLSARIIKPVSYQEVPSVYADADVIVFPSIWPEPFGRIAIEAAASGTIVIGSEIAGITETISTLPKRQGILCKVGDAEDLAEKIQEVLAANMKDKKEVTLENYSTNVICAKLLEVYHGN